MGFISRLLTGGNARPREQVQSPDQAQSAEGESAQPRNQVQSSGGGVVINSSADLVAALRDGLMGDAVSPAKALQVAAVFACVRIISGTVANLPVQIKQRVDENTRREASEHPAWNILRRKPNKWQTPSQFKRMMQAHLLLRGNAYAAIVMSRGKLLELIPLNPDRVEPKQNDDLSMSYRYTRKDGRVVTYSQKEMFHLVGMSLDGVTGVSVLTYARNTIGLSSDMEKHGRTTFKNGARISNVLKHPGKLGTEGIENLRASLNAFRSGGENEGKDLILEEDMDIAPMSMTSQDAQWLESRKFSRTDIAMFFGVPPHMLGDTEKSTSFGTGLEQQTTGFRIFTAEDHLTTWEETVDRDLIGDKYPDHFCRFNRKALVRGDIKTRQGFYVAMLQWGVYSPNEVRRLEDDNPRDGGNVYYDPPNTAGGEQPEKEERENEPPETS